MLLHTTFKYISPPNKRICAQFEPSCLRVAVEVHIPDLLLDRPNGVHVNELSEKTGIESGKLGRILRLLAIRHCFCEGQIRNCTCRFSVLN